MAKADNEPQSNMSAFVVGYTGETGKALVKELAQRKVFSRVALIGRRRVEYSGDSANDFDQTQVDFDKLETDHQEDFKGYDVGFIALGTTKGKSGADGFYKVDHDYVMSTARLAKAGGCKHLQLVSSQGANKNSMLLYPKTKGQVEDEISKLDFDQFSILRPAVLMVDREEKRFGESFFRAILKPVQYCAPTLMTTPIETLAQAMVNLALNQPEEKVKMCDNKCIFELAKPKTESQEKK